MNEQTLSGVTEQQTRRLAEEAVRVLLEKQAREVAMLFVREVTSVTDYYINVTGRSASHVASLADDAAERIEQTLGRVPLRVEGRGERSWILVDYGDVILNIFDAASRDFYKLDRLFPAETQQDITALKSEVDRKFDITVKET